MSYRRHRRHVQADKIPTINIVEDKQCGERATGVIPISKEDLHN